MISKRSQEGYFLLDHRNSPGLSESQVFAASLPPGAGRGYFEAPVITCSHCQRGVVLNPLRNRDRSYCAKCDHYICDECGAVLKAGGVCKPYKQIIDEIYEQGVKANG